MAPGKTEELPALTDQMSPSDARLVLTVNAGSSSVRLSLLKPHEQGPKTIAADRYDARGAAPDHILATFLGSRSLVNIDAVAHRVVHGGARLIQPCIVDDAVEREIERLSVLAPLHNPAALAWIDACRARFSGVTQVAVFDTAFFASLPPISATYALPWDLCQRHEIRRYGFHGIAHQAMWRRWQALRRDLGEGGRVISLQLGAGCSVAAIAKGRPMDTSMGFSPVEGLVMATRSGDLDPGVVTFLQNEEGLSPDEVFDLLNRGSGLLGLSGRSGDMSELLRMTDARAEFAIDVFCYRISKYIGAYLAVLDGVDGILFGGGIGENAPRVRERIVSRLGWCGAVMDRDRNVVATGTEARISDATSKIDLWVVPVDEAAILAEEALRLLREFR